ncbi:adenylate/guanylate cyclase domain-containing protein [Schleiferiaceae bacterium]|nr:adenylate/guanylate cyclase domain-containing protein [Schleiferiaceae bacterium]
MIRRKLTLLLFILSTSLHAQKQAFLTDRGEAHWLDSISFEYQSFRRAQTVELRAQAKSKASKLLREVEGSSADSAIKSVAYYRGFNFWDKRRESKIYLSILKRIKKWAPRDSVQLRFFSNYQTGNTFIFLEDYDSAAFYLNQAFDIDIQNDLGKYEGSVQDRAALILYLLEDYENSLSLSEFSLRWAKGRLRAAVYNQLGNTHNRMGNFQEAALAYDSASLFFERTGVASWLPKFNSMNAYLELGKDGEEKFLEAYSELTKNKSVLNYQAYVDALELSRAEICLAYWEDSSRYNFEDLNEILLKPSPESIRFIRSALAKKIVNTEGEWKKNREAYIMLKRFFVLVRQDSIQYALKNILEIDAEFIQELSRDNENLVAAANRPRNELKSLISKIGKEELLRSDKNSDRVEENIVKGMVKIVLTHIPLIICFIALNKTVKSRKEIKSVLDKLTTINTREKKLLESMVLGNNLETVGLAGNSNFKQYNDVIVINIQLDGVTSSMSILSNDLFTKRLEDIFNRLAAVSSKHGLQRLKTDGTSLVLVGGINEDYVSPSHALQAAKDMHKSIKAFNHTNQEFESPVLLRIGADIGSVYSGLPGDLSLLLDMWGDVFPRVKKLELSCPTTKTVLSQKVIDAEHYGVKWPKSEVIEVESIKARIFE